MMIGITGSLGSGKTTVAKMFKRLGAYVIDVDELYHSLIKPGKKLYRKIVQQFGKGILKENKAIGTKKLAQVVFRKKSKLKTLNQLTHPEVIKKIKDIIASKKGKFIIVDAALLIESGFYKELDKLIVMKIKKDTQLNRIRGITKKEALTRIRMQAPFKEKAALADFIIDNTGSKKETLSQVKRIWENINYETLKG